MNRLHSNKNIIATKMGRNGAVLGHIPHFGPFSLKLAEGVPKRWKINLHQI
jgi:hypothetical protein